MTDHAANAGHFLVVDDDVNFAAMLARSLERRGYRVAIANDGEMALRLADGQDFAAITIDLQLGHMSGLKLIEPMRARQPGARMLVLTGYASIATAVAAVKLGADDYLAKPVNTEAILAALRVEPAGSRFTLHDGPGNPASPLPVVPATPMSVPRLEWEHIQRVLAECDGNISAAARQLNMHRRTLQRKLAKHPVAR